MCMCLQANKIVREDEEAVETKLPAVKKPAGALRGAVFLGLEA